MPKTKMVTITVISTIIDDRKHYLRGWGAGYGTSLCIDGYTTDIDQARECFDEEHARECISRFKNHHGRVFFPETVTIPESREHAYQNGKPNTNPDPTIN